MVPVRKIAAILLILTVSACASPPTSDGILDPHEARNRQIHAANRGLDSALVRPASNAYGNGIPEPVRDGVGNFADNLSMPSRILNNVLQLDLEGAVRNSFRFAFNTTFGLAGVFDVATEMGLPVEETDFGETLYVWGVNEGNYVELPIIGPSTERHMVGRAIDIIIDPVGLLVGSPDRYIGTGAQAFARVGDRFEYGATVDSILYESEDSYAQARLLYLQNRRFQLGVETSAEEIDEIDALFEDLYGE